MSAPPADRRPARVRKARPTKRRRAAAPAAAVVYGPGRYRPAPNGRGYDVSVSLGGVRSRARVASPAAAQAWIDATEAGRLASAPPVTRALLLDAQHARMLLPPGVSLADAARAWLGLHAAAAPDSPPLSACLGAFLADRAERRVRPVTLQLYRQAVRRVILRLGDVPAASVTREHVSRLVAGLGPHSRNGLLRHAGAFFEWCRETGRAPSNPAAAVPRARTPEPPKGVLAPRQVGAVMAAAAARMPALVPYLALAFFAGVRPEELRRLRPERIGARYILLDGSVTKTADTRSVEVRPHLAAWLGAYPPPPGRPVPPLSRKHLYAAIRKVRADTLRLAHELQEPALAVHAWPADCARHCFATYMYEKTRDAAAVAAEMGHKGLQVFFAHYRALAAPGDGASYTSITPESVAVLTAACQRLLQTVGNEGG